RGVDRTSHCLGYGRGQSSAHRGPSLRPVDPVRVDPESVLTGHQASRRVRAPDTVRTVRTDRKAKRNQCLLDLLYRRSRRALAEDTGGERVGVSAVMRHPHLHFTALRQCLTVQNHAGREHVVSRPAYHVAVGSGFTRRPGKRNGRPFAWLEDHFLVPRKPHKFRHVVSHTAVYRPNISIRRRRGTGLFVHAVAIPVLTVPRAGSVPANRSHRTPIDRDYDFDVGTATGAVHSQIPHLGSRVETSTATPPCHLLQA